MLTNFLNVMVGSPYREAAVCGMSWPCSLVPGKLRGFSSTHIFQQVLNVRRNIDAWDGPPSNYFVSQHGPGSIVPLRLL
jgi:hypothetical protein